MNNVPLAGDEFEVVGSLDVARDKAESRAEYLRNERITAKSGDGKVTLSSYASAVSSGKNAGLDLHQLNIILKVDVQVRYLEVLDPLRPYDFNLWMRLCLLDAERICILFVSIGWFLIMVCVSTLTVVDFSYL